MTNKFDRLFNVLNEAGSLKINDQGAELLKQYYQMLDELKKGLIDTLHKYVPDVEDISKALIVQIISSINTKEQGSDLLKLMIRLDTLTSGGKGQIDPSTTSFHQQDNILKYLEEIG